MSIFPEVLGAIQAEHARRAISGDLLLIGRQRLEFYEMTDQEFFARFPIASFKALGASSFEGADLVWDLNKRPLPKTLEGISDFIFDGSCLDNIFDPAQALRSLSRMLRPGGRMILVEHGTAIQGALCVFSPEWFYDFFVANDYLDCRITMMAFPKGGLYAGPWTPIPWQPYKDNEPTTATPGTAIGDFMNVVIAEKGPDSTNDRAPMQAQYRIMHGDSDDKYRDFWRNSKGCQP